MDDKLAMLGELVRTYAPDLSFTMLEVGAFPLDAGAQEPFYALLDIFPKSRVVAFEVDEDLCRELNECQEPGRVLPSRAGAQYGATPVL